MNTALHGTYLHNPEQCIKDVLFGYPYFRPRVSEKFQAKYKGKYSSQNIRNRYQRLEPM